MCTREVLHGMNTTSMSFEQFTNTVESIAPYYAILNGIGEPLDKLAASLPDMVTFSLDGATKTSYEQIRVLGNFDQSLRNYQELLQLRLEGKTRPNTRV